MSKTKSNYDSNNPNGIIDEAERGRQLYNKIKSESDYSIQGYIKAKKQLVELEKQIRDVQRVAEDATGKDKKRLEAYISELEDEQVRLDNLSRKLQENLGATSDEQMKKIQAAAERSIQKISKEIDDEINKLEKEKESLSPDDEKKRAEIDKKIEAQKTRKEKLTELSPLAAVGLPGSITSALIESLGSKSGVGSLLSVAAGRGNAAKVEDTLDKIGTNIPMLGKMDDLVKATQTIINVLGSLRQSMTKSIENAASALSSYYGPIKANLENSGLTYEQLSEDVSEALGFSKLVKQTDYLNEIAQLTNQGLVTDVEQRALLQVIKDRVLTSFNATNTGLLRLIRLGEQDTINQFGIELQLKRMLNTKLFGDASYLQGLFDSVTSALIDVSTATKSDLTNFSSTVQTWLGAMYSQGLSDSVVSAIATGINALGSGNVSALASDESVQRLFLLSMDRIGMDYADILQQGLSSEDTNNLLASIIEYLNEIATNTSDNLVLKSSYSNLFNMSMSDMQAIQNVYSKIGEITGGSNIINSSDALAITQNAIANTLAENTLASQMFDNFFANFSYSFGSNIAEDGTLYTKYRLADMTYDILDRFSQVGGALGKALNIAKLAPAVVQFGIGGKSLIDMIGNYQSFFNSNNTLLNLLGPSSISGDNTSTYTTTSADNSTSSFKSFKQTMATTVEAAQASAADWEGEAEDEVLGVLKELSKTLMKLKEGEGYAFAVSVEGMNDSVLRSFASIFADEDAMLATFTGENNVLSDALFGYFDDTTSNTEKPTEVQA